MALALALINSTISSQNSRIISEYFMRLYEVRVRDGTRKGADRVLKMQNECERSFLKEFPAECVML